MAETTKQGIFYWNELMTSDPAGAREFYSSLLGWTPSIMNMENPVSPAEPGDEGYTVWMVGETPAGGMMKMEGPQFDNVPPHWMSYISVDDVDAIAAKTSELGGNVLMQPTEIKNVGRFAIITDPTGAALGVITPAPMPSG